MMFLSAIVIVGFYFERRRALAATIAMCGSGFGTAGMAPLFTHLLQNFKWTGSLVLICGIIMQGVVLG